MTALWRRTKTRVRDVLFALGDTLCGWSGTRSDEGVTRPWLFWLGHQVSEIGWRFR